MRRLRFATRFNLRAHVAQRDCYAPGIARLTRQGKTVLTENRGSLNVPAQRGGESRVRERLRKPRYVRGAAEMEDRVFAIGDGASNLPSFHMSQHKEVERLPG